MLEKYFRKIAVYRYPGVRIASLIARVKIIQTAFSILYLPYSSYQFTMGNMSAAWFYSGTALAVIAPLTLIIYSRLVILSDVYRYLNKLIGVIAMNENNEIVRVGHLTFWGSRRNNGKFLYLAVKNAEIVDEERAKLLFGDLSFFRY
ncbi:hypothetical protein DICVIV_00360 [Dictyocaulus viviparus]|uniref:Transmembrane protein 186 n=1 Tax=Dictyocaulus viviparus TaxID=29172 RepID=A0A0D8YB40_DICVI|nr:hypothetical protein DICVIV_00360 [Dictyocaulus viviparus]